MITETVRELKKIKGVKALYLFGSYSKGTQKPLSDIDICVITDRNIPEDKKMMIYAHSSKKIDISLFWDLPLNIRFRVFKDGKLLFCKNKLFLHRVKVETMKLYQDFKPVVDRYIFRVLGVKNV